MSENSSKTGFSLRQQASQKRRIKTQFNDPLPSIKSARESFESALTIQKATFVKQNKSFPGASSSKTFRTTNKVADSSSNESFSSAHSSLHDDQKILTLTASELSKSYQSPKMACDVSDEKFLTAVESDSFCLFNKSASVLDFTDIGPDPELPEVNDETLPSYEEEMVEVPSFEINDTLLKSHDVPEDHTDAVDQVNPSAILDDSSPANINDVPCQAHPSISSLDDSFTSYIKDASTNTEDILRESHEHTQTVTLGLTQATDLLTSAVTSQSYLEVLAEDSDAQIEALMKIRDEEMAMNESLRDCVSDLDAVKETVGTIVADVEDSYIQSYKELEKKHESEMKLIKCEAENRVTELSAKLEIASLQLVAKEELELALQKRVEELEGIIRKKEEDCKEELEGVVAKCLRCDILSAAHSEVLDEADNVHSQNPTEISEYAGDFDTSKDPQEAGIGLLKSQMGLEISALQEKSKNFEDECVALRIRVNDLESQLNFDNSGVDDLMSGRECLGVSAMQSQLNEVTEEASKLRDEYLSLKLSKTDVDERYEELKKEANDLRAQVEAAVAERDKAQILNDEREKVMKEFAKSLEDVTSERDELLADKAAHEKELKEAKFELAQMKDRNIDLEKKLFDIVNEKQMILSEKENLRDRQISFDATIAELKRELDSLTEKNMQLETTCAEFGEIKAQRFSLETELDQLKREFRMSGSFNNSFNLSSVLKELNVDGSGLKELDILNGSVVESLDNASKVRHSTQYFGVALPSNPCEAACQTSVLSASNSPAEHPPANTKNCCCDKSQTLEKELQVSWTERCELEQKLAEIISENVTLRTHTRQLEAATRRVTGLCATGMPSVAAWLQLRQCVQDIVAEITVLKNTPSVLRNPLTNGSNLDASLLNATEYLKPPLALQLESVEERSSPEGCRASPPIMDGAIAEEHETTSSIAEDVPLCLHSHVSEQGLDALGSLLNELRQYAGVENSVDGDGNYSVNTTQSERVSMLLDSSNIRGSLELIMEEVGRLNALSNPDGTVAKLHLQITSLEDQVMNSDKKLRSMQAYLQDQTEEREHERDEAAERIEQLTDAIRVRDRQLARKELLEQDMVILEQQLSEAQMSYHEEKEKRTLLEERLEQMVRKVDDMREIMADLEMQLVEKSQQLESAGCDILELKQQLVESGQMSLERENAQQNSFSDTMHYVAKLEEEVTALRRQVDLSGPESISSVRSVIRELEAMVARRTRDMELVQVFCRYTASSASEELSTRDHIDATRCATPDEMACEVGLGLCEDVERLKERLTKHARMEEAAIKRMKELEVNSGKVDEVQMEIEMAMRRVDQLLEENETLKTRLEGARPRADDAHMIATLEGRVRQLEGEIEAATVALQAEKQLVAEKVRREERLQEGLMAREADLRVESETLKAVKEQLQGEAQKRVALENNFKELLNKFKDLSYNSKENLSRSGEEKNLSGSSGSSKRVRFHEPHSFVDSSVTPIPHELVSMLRDDPSAQANWSLIEPFSRMSVPVESISSIAALHLSPRGMVPATQSSLALQATQEKLPQRTNDSAQQKKTMQEDKGVIMQRLSEAKELLISMEEKRQINETEIRDLRAQLNMEKEARESITKTTQEEIVKKCAQISELTADLEKSHKKMLSLRKQVEELEADLENERARSVALATDLRLQRDMVITQLESQRSEAIILKDQLQFTVDELHDVKNEKGKLEKDLLDRLEVMKESSESHNQSFDQIEALRKEKSLLMSREAELLSRLDVLEAQLAGKVEEGDAAHRVLQERENLISSLKREVENKAVMFDAEKKKFDEIVKRMGEEEERMRVKEEQLRAAEAAVDALQEKLELVISERNQLNQALNASRDNDGNSPSEWQKLCSAAGDKIASLRTCLETSLLKNASLEANLAIMKGCLESAESKAAVVESKLRAVENEKASLLRAKQDLLESMEGLERRHHQEDDPYELLAISVQLEKVREELTASKTKEVELKKMLKSALQLGKDASSRETELRKKLTASENEVLKLQHSLTNQAVNLRALEHFHHQEPTRSQDAVRLVREMRDGEADWEYRVCRLESYRKALVFQKQLLVTSAGCRLARSSRQRRRPRLRIVAIMIIALCRMRYLVRRWRSRLPPINSPPRRSGRHLLLTSASPPCKDPGLKLN